MGAVSEPAGEAEMEQVTSEMPPLLKGSGCRMVRLRRAAAGFARGDLLLVVPGIDPEGGEFVIDMLGRLGRHGGGPVWGVVVGAVRRGTGGR